MRLKRDKWLTPSLVTQFHRSRCENWVAAVRRVGPGGGRAEWFITLE